MQYSIFDLLKLLGSLGFFLFGMKLMSESLQKVAGDRMRGILSAMTSNRFKGLFTGFLITAIIQSSSATTVMLVSFVNAGLVTFGESIGVIMGSNIGTTVTAWLISILGFKIKISILVLPLIGLTLPLLFSKNTTRSNWGTVIIGFAIIFIGLDFLNQSTPDIKNNPEILGFLTQYSNYGFLSILIFLFFGTVLTMIIQSSSATMALTLIMCYNGWISFEMAAAMVLGQNIGTTITANLAALVANTSAKRTAVAHLFFNLVGVILILPVLIPFLKMVGNFMVSSGGHSPFAVDGQISEQTAAAIPIALSIFHTVFNVLNTFILIWFVKPMEKLILKLIKQKEDEEEFKLQYISTGLLSTGELSVLQASKELTVYTQRVAKMFDQTQSLIQQTASKKIIDLQTKISKGEKFSDQLELEISNYLTEVSRQELSNHAAESINRKLMITTHIESIADSCYSISNAIGRRSGSKIKFSESMTDDLTKFSKRVSELFTQLIGIVNDSHFKIDKDDLAQLMKKIQKNYEKLQQDHFKNLRKGIYKTKVGVIYADIYTEFYKMSELIYQVTHIIAFQDKDIATE